MEPGDRRRRARPSDQSARLYLFNGFRLTLAGRTVDLQPGAQRLLAFIGLREQPVHRSFVAGSLWPDTDDRHAAANLRSTLWRIRQSGGYIVDTRGSRLGLSPGVSVDVRDAVVQARRLLRSEGTLAEGDVDPSLLLGELLPDWWDEWLAVDRERLRQLRIHALERLAERLFGAGRIGEAMEASLAAVAAEPLRESAHRLVIRLHLAAGNRADALRQCELYARMLRDAVGTEPSPLMRALVSAPEDPASEPGGHVGIPSAAADGAQLARTLA